MTLQQIKNYLGSDYKNCKSTKQIERKKNEEINREYGCCYFRPYIKIEEVV